MSLRLRWLTWRNRVIASPRFQFWASRIPGVRWIARGRAEQVFDLIAGFVYSQTTLACVETGLLEELQSGPRHSRELPARLGLSTAATRRLTLAAQALDLIEQAEPELWVLGQQGAALAGNSGALAMVRHHKLLYQDLYDPVALLQQDRTEETALSSFWSYASKADRTDSDTRAYSELMAASQTMVAEQVVERFRFGRYRAMLDVGGGHGVFVGAVAKASAGLRLGLFDLPSVADCARDSLARQAIDPPVEIHSGDFFKTGLPMGYDLVTLVRILHDHDDGPALQLLRNIRNSIPPGAHLLIAEPMAGTPQARAMGDAYFGWYLWAMRSGRPRTIEEITDLLREAGFASWREIKTRQPLVTRALLAKA